MKKLVSLVCGLLLALTFAYGQDTCHIAITGSFDSECQYDFKNLPVSEYPDIMIACQHSTVTYTAHADVGTATVASCTWEVYGDVTHTSTGNQVTVGWGNGSWGLLVVTVATTAGDTCTESSYVGLIESPTVAASTVPAYTIDGNGDKVIRVCRHSRVEFIDQSDAHSSDIAGYLWESKEGGVSTLPHYVIGDVTMDNEVTHRVYNNCGCYDEETYLIEVIDGEPLVLDCYGTVCDGTVVTYGVSSPACSDYYWHVEGGTLVDGQYSDHPTVHWDRPQGGYGVLSLDGVRCGVEVCPAMMSVRVPVIEDSLDIVGPQGVCLGESAVYRLPLFGSTEYDWVISPDASEQGLYDHGNEMRYTFNTAGTYHITVSYRCDFLDCGPYHTRELEVNVRPKLAIEGQDRICSANACSLHTEPLVSATWQAYDLGNGNQPVGSAATGGFFTETFAPGRYLVTAEHPGYCGPATFVLNVLNPPPAPTVAEMDPGNRHTACPNGGIGLTGTPSEPNYLLVWAPACSTATPQLYTGDSVNIGYGAEVCDIRVYHYDVLLQCQSTGYYVHTVTALAPGPTTLPDSITVCPNSLVSLTGMVPDQRADGMLYEWKIQPTMQHCASVTGSHQAPDVTLLINKLNNATAPYTFYVDLIRSWCNGSSDTHRIYITVRQDLQATLTVSGPTQVCEGSQAIYSCSGCSPHACPDATYSFPEAGTHYVTFYCNPYDYCDNRNLYTPASLAVTVWTKPEVSIEYDDTFPGTLTANVTGTGPFSYYWEYRDLALGSQWVYVGSTAVIQDYGAGYYRCTVTDGHGCTNEVTYHHSTPATPCSTMTLGHGSYDYCYHSIQVTSPYSTRNVTWTVEGGDYGIVTSGTNNSVATVTVMDNGPYTVCAKTRAPIPGTMTEGCYEGCYTFTADFVGDFTFEARCDTIVIHNQSKYLNGNNHVYMEVRIGNNIVGSFNFPVAQDEYKYVTPQNGTYDFYLTQYGSNTFPQPCPMGSATINLPSNRSVSISTNNTNDPTATCDNTPIELIATLNPAYATIVSSTWSFGDGSTYTTEGGSVYHTFSLGPKFVTVTVTDSRGCGLTSNPPLSITSNQDNLSIGNGDLLQNYPKYCPHVLPPMTNVYFTIDPLAPVNHYTWSVPSTGSGSSVLVSEPMDCLVSVVNDFFCQKEATRRALFKPCPTARIHAERYSCCEGEPLPLYGSLAPKQNISYMWSIASTPPGYSATFNTPDIVFTPPAAGTYTVTLTVTDNDPTSGCSSSTQATVTAVAKPAAPTLYFPGDSCISGAPVTVAATAASYSGELHWSNGETGATARYYTPGNATAYYYDPAVGCASQTGAILIHRQPDFDALLTGCYEKCQSFLAGYLLPVYCLTPNRIGWQWYMGAGILASATSAYMPLSLPLVRPDTYRLEVDYQNGGCHDASPNLTIADKTVCDCDSIRVEVQDVSIHVIDCEVYYEITLKVCNDNTNNDFCIDDVLVLSDNHHVTIDNVNYTSSTVHANSCETVYLNLRVTGLIPTDVLLRIVDESCLDCTKDFSVGLTWDVNCEKELGDGYIEPETGLSNEAAVYCEFGAGLDPGCVPLAVWTEPAMVLEHQWDATTGYMDGLCMFDRAVLTRMATEEGVVCLHVLLCCDDDLCDYFYCVDASAILEAFNRRDSIHGEESMMRHPRSRPVESHRPHLVPNPTTGEVAIEISNPRSGGNVTGTPDEVAEVTVMDMHGRKMATFKDTDLFNIKELPAGSYIVRVKTRRNKEASEEVTYLKLVKK